MTSNKDMGETNYLDSDFLKYRPFFQGFSPSGMGLKKIAYEKSDPKSYTFQINPEDFSWYRNAKIECRKDLSEYYAHREFPAKASCEWIINCLCKEYPQYFEWQINNNEGTLYCSLTQEKLIIELNTFELKNLEAKIPYIDLFDALAMQVPEDIVIHYVGAETNHAAAIHLCHANGWSAKTSVLKSFEDIHTPVPRFPKIVPNSQKLLGALVRSPQEFERLGGLCVRSSQRLDRHPRYSREEKNPPFMAEQENFYFRFERQTLNKIDDSHFMFTIRTYISQMAALAQESDFFNMLDAHEANRAEFAKLEEFFVGQAKAWEEYKSILTKRYRGDNPH